MEVFKDKECVVCGAPTTKTCSACKKLFLCSPEHQKLLWPMHKHLCGKEGYSPPALTEDEVKWAEDCVPPTGYMAERIKSQHDEFGEIDYALKLSSIPYMIVNHRRQCLITMYPGYGPDRKQFPLLSFALVAFVEHELYMRDSNPGDVQLAHHVQQQLKRFAYLSYLEVAARTSNTHLEGSAEVDFGKECAAKVTAIVLELRPYLRLNAQRTAEMLQEMRRALERVLVPGRSEVDAEMMKELARMVAGSYRRS